MKIKPQKVSFRTKGSHRQGMGDIMGSLALAEEFKLQRHLVTFIIDNDIEAIHALKKTEYEFFVVKNSNEKEAWRGKYYDISIVNQLTTSYRQLSVIKGHSKLLVTIDDTGSASKKIASLRINPLYYDKGARCDSKYIPLNRFFQGAHKQRKSIRSNMGRILVTMGGSDTYGFTPQVVKALQIYHRDVDIKIIAGPAFKHSSILNNVISKLKRRFDIFHNVSIRAMCKWIQWADIAICGGGNTLFEMACCGTPAIVICGEPFEEETAYRLAKMGFGKVLPFNKKLDLFKINNLMNDLEDRKIRIVQSKNGKAMVDGMGTKRIFDDILTLRKGVNNK